MFTNAREVEDNLQACTKFLEQIWNEYLLKEAYETKRLGLDADYQQQKFGLRSHIFQNADVLSFDFSYFPDPKITKSFFSSSKNDFYEVEYANDCQKDYVVKGDDYFDAMEVTDSKRLAMDTQKKIRFIYL